MLDGHAPSLFFYGITYLTIVNRNPKTKIIMPITAILLLFGSAFLHTAWNLLLKQAREKYIATWWAVLLGSAIFLPFLFFTGLPARETWGLLFASVLAEMAYYIILSAAYRDADFSLVYPLARGAAPMMIVFWSVLFLGERLTPGGILGLGIIVAGLIIVGGSSVLAAHQDGRAPHWHGIGLALLLAFFISVYSVIDGAAVKRTDTFPYATLVFFLSPALSAPLVLRRYGWQTLKNEFSQHRILLWSIGLLTVSAYMLALVAYSIAKVSYSGAIREVSVVLGALAGWRFLGEEMGSLRVAGALAIFGGILVVALTG
jgi:drug/metabolite transporter (DMT)-like permease